MTYIPKNANGQAASANSAPVVIASDQSAVPISGTTTVQQSTASSLNAQVVGTIASGSTDSGNPVKVGGKYNATAPTLTDGQRGDIQLDASGNAKTYLATKLDSVNDSITNLAFGHSYVNITTNTTTTIKTGGGVIKAVYVNTKGASSNTATVYDNTAGSGTKIGTIDTTATQGPFLNDIAFVTGLTIVTATGTAADITVAYR